MHFSLLIYFNNHLHVSDRPNYTSPAGSILCVQHVVFIGPKIRGTLNLCIIIYIYIYIVTKSTKYCIVCTLRITLTLYRRTADRFI
jgi:hypothetical protein